LWNSNTKPNGYRHGHGHRDCDGDRDGHTDRNSNGHGHASSYSYTETHSKPKTPSHTKATSNPTASSVTENTRPVFKAGRRLTAERTQNKVERVVPNALTGLASASGEDDPPSCFPD
jgi:hypothetical protein